MTELARSPFNTAPPGTALPSVGEVGVVTELARSPLDTAPPSRVSEVAA